MMRSQMMRSRWHSQWLAAALMGTVAMVVVAEDAIALSAQEIQQRARSFTVLIDGINPGSGVIVAHEPETDRYWVLTAQHVVATEDEYWVVTSDAEAHRVDYAQVHKLSGVDLALVEFRSRRTYPLAPLADYPTSQEFPHVFVSGWSGSQISQQPQTQEFTAGRLLRDRYALTQVQTPLTYGYGLFYTSMTEVGMSGGAILDTDGRVIGIHGRSEGEALYDARTGRSERLQLGFSSGVPIRRLRTLAERVPTTARWNWDLRPPRRPAPMAMASIEATLEPVATRPQTPVAWANRGNQLYRLERFPEALTAFRQAIELRPDFHQAWYGVANVLTTQGRYPEAIDAYNRVLQLQPNFHGALRDRAIVWVLMNQPERAVADFDQMVQRWPQDYVTWFLRGNLFWKQLGWYEAALGSYDRALDLEPSFADAWIERGRVLLAMGQPQEAIGSLQRAVQLDPDSRLGWYWLGASLHQTQAETQALVALNRALSIQAQHIDSLVLKGQVLMALGRSAEARTVWQQVLALEPNHAQAQRLLQSGL